MHCDHVTAGSPPLRAPHLDRIGPVLVLAAVVVVAAVGVPVLLAHYGVFGGSSASSRVTGSGVAATQARELPAFTSVELSGSNNVRISVGDPQAVVVHADDNLLSHVTTRVAGETLVVGNTPGSFSTRSPMSVEIRLPSLDALRLTGSGTIDASGIRADAFSLAITGSGDVWASGRATSLRLTLAGSGVATADQLTAEQVNVVLAGAGTALVRATKRLDASVPGTGSVVYHGAPAQVRTNVSGSGVVVPG